MTLPRDGEISRLPSHILYEIMVPEVKKNVVLRKIDLKFNVTQNDGK
jgi:hypothetical protein